MQPADTLLTAFLTGEAATPGLAAAAAVGVAADIAAALSAEAAWIDGEGAFPVESLQLLRDCGLLAAPLPEQHGGAGLGEPRFRLQLLHVLAHLGRGSLPVGRIYEGHVNALALIEAFAEGPQAETLFNDAKAGHLFSVWNTEAGDGLRMGARRAGRLPLEGSKTFASGAGFVSRALVTARDPEGGWQMAVVPVDTASPAIDRSFWKPLGMRASASYKVDFTGLALGHDDLLGQPGDYYREPAFGAGAVRFAAVQQGGVEAIFDETRHFLRRIGRTVDPFQRARIGEMAMLVESGRQWLRGAAHQALTASRALRAESGDGVSAVAHAHLMRTAIETIALRVLQLAERCIGARGLISPEPFERLHRDLTHYLRQAAPDAAVAAAGEYALSRTEAAHELWSGFPIDPGAVAWNHCAARTALVPNVHAPWTRTPFPAVDPSRRRATPIRTGRGSRTSPAASIWFAGNGEAT